MYNRTSPDAPWVQLGIVSHGIGTFLYMLSITAITHKLIECVFFFSFFVFLKGVPDQDIRLSTPGCRITGRGSGSFREFDHEISPSLPRPFTPSNSHATKRVASSRATREKTRKILFGDQSCFSSFDHLFPICYNKCNDI